MKRSARLLISVVIGVALAALIAYAQTRNANTPAGIAGTQIGNNFEGLIDQNGNAVTQQSFAGKYQLVFFGFTHCPSICPTELLRMKTLLQDLTAGEREQLALIFVTVDPERDTAAVMKDYIAMFDPAITGLTGTKEAIKKTTDAWKVYAAKVEMEEGDYMMDHSGYLYFRGPDARLLDLYEGDEPTPEITAKIKAQIPDKAP